jgi:hypothetical protein
VSALVANSGPEPALPADLRSRRAHASYFTSLAYAGAADRHIGNSEGHEPHPRRCDAEQVRQLSDMTIAYYDRFAEAFWEGTRERYQGRES